MFSAISRLSSSLRARPYVLSAGLVTLGAGAACHMRPQPPPPGEHPDDVTPVTSQAARDDRLTSVRVPISPLGPNKAYGNLIFTQLPGDAGVQIEGVVLNLSPGAHGMHVHEHADCSGKDGLAAGPHYNPTRAPHGDIESAKSHLGDLGNIEANPQGRAEVHIVKKGASLDDSAQSLMNHSVLIHAGPDDLETQPAGDSGARVACGLVTPGGR